MSELVEAVLPLGLVPPVVPEFKALTVGGLIAGAGLESSSFVQGQFCAALDSAKVVLADGSVLDCSREENEELFWGMLGAYGTFGLLVSATLRLEEAKSGWVRVRYQPTQDIVDDIRAVCKEGSDDYVDGIAFGPTCGVIIRGSRSAAPPPPDARILHLSRASSPWFSKHIESALRIKNATWSTPTLLQPIEEWLPLQDYLFRYDRGAYWMGKYALEILPFGYNLISRTLLAPLLTTEALYRRLHAAPEHIVESTLVIQDIYIPEEGAAEFMEFVGSGEAAEDTQIYPLWLCPIKSASNASKLSPNYVEEGNKLFINFGIWHHADHWTPGSPVPKATTRRLERRAHEVGGRKMLYAQTYYTDKEWRSIYDMEWYAFAKSMWDPEGVFGDLRKKIGRG
ncbi:Delta(24)-sterol reductase [Saitoella coloradoensis]